MQRAFQERWESAANGIDGEIQGIGGDPYQSITQTCLRVPTLATPDANSRYLFLLSSFSVAEGTQKIITGIRQAATIIAKQVDLDEERTRFIEQSITSPFWHFTDGNISWHLRFIAPTLLRRLTPMSRPATTLGGTTIPNVAFLMSDTPGLLVDNGTVFDIGGDYLDLTAYVPPQLGRPYGVPMGHLGTFHDLRFEWLSSEAWDSACIPCTEPGTYAFFASVRQTNFEDRLAITPPTTFYPLGLPPEEQFLLNFTTAIYGRVGGSLIVEEMPVR